MDNTFAIDCIIGIDPGANGGIAVYVPGEYRPLMITHKMPKDISELRDFFQYYMDNFKPIVFLEKLSVRPDDVTTEGARINMGKLYRIQQMMANYEHLKALMESCGIPYVMVHPMTWQTKLQLRKRGIDGVKEEKAERKRRYQREAAKLYPQIRVTLWNSDALLIMHFGRWAMENTPKWVKEQLPEREYKKLF